MDCVPTKSKKKPIRAKAPRARGRRATFHGCSSIEEPVNLDPCFKTYFVKTPTSSDILYLDNSSDAKSEKENETVLHAEGLSVGIQLGCIGESTTDDLQVDKEETFDVDNEEKNAFIDILEVKENTETSDDKEEVLKEIEDLSDAENDPNKEKIESAPEKDSDKVTVGTDEEAFVKDQFETLPETEIVPDKDVSDKSPHSDIESETEPEAENSVADMDACREIQDNMSNLDSEGEINFEAKSHSEDENVCSNEVDVSKDESEKVENECKTNEKSKIEIDQIMVGESNNDATYAAFSEFVDHLSITEDIKDEESDSGDIVVGRDMLLQYMKKNLHKQLKASLRNGGWGLTNDVRGSLWYNLCHYLHKADDMDMFSEFAEDLFSPGDFSEIGIPSFVDMQHLSSYHLSTVGIYTAKQILCVLGHSCPDIIYSPVLFSMLSIFLHYMDRSQCYNCLYSLLRHKDGTFIPTTKVSYEASKLVMRDLAKKYAKSGYVYLVRNSGNIDQIFDSWIWWIFEDLPMIFLVRIMDCYLQEGIKIFYRISLAILILFSKTHSKKSSPKKSSSSGNALTALRQFCREMPLSVHKLMKTCFSIKGLSRKEIHKLQIKHEMFVTSTKNVNSYDNQKSSKLTMSRSFSGPIILQNLGTDTLTSDMLYALLTWLPTRYAICQPELLYTSEEHGTSLVTLYQRVEHYQPTVIIIKTTNDEVFGAFCSTYWRERRQKSQLLSYFGTGETFIFTLSPEKKKYDWVGLSEENIPNTASMFQAGDRSILTVGGGHGEAISLDETMLHCRSEHCDTFNNEPLSQSEDFVCKVVEVYGFQ